MEVGKKYLAIEYLTSFKTGYKIARITEINERYIWAVIYERYNPKIVKFSRMTLKEYRPKYYRHYKLTKKEDKEIENMLAMRSINSKQYN